MDLVKKKKEIKIDDIEYIICFDMKSILTYKQLTGRFFSHGITNLFKLDDEEIIYFIASTLRIKEEEDEPLGLEVINGDVLAYLINFKNIVIEIIAESLPTGDNSKKK